MWLSIACFLSCFNISKAQDEFGNEIEIDDTYNTVGTVLCVLTIKFSSTPVLTGKIDLQS